MTLAPWTSAALAISVPLLVLFIGALMATRRERPANLWLAVALVAVLLLQGVVYAQLVRWVDRLPYLLHVAVVLHAVHATFLYLYVRAFTDPTFRWSAEPRWVFAPIFAALLWYVGGAVFFPDGDRWLHSETYFRERWFSVWVLVGVYAFFLHRSFEALDRYQRRLRESRSSLEGLSLRWLRFLLYGCGFLVVLGIVDGALGPERALWNEILLYWAVIACSLAFFTLRHSPNVGAALAEEDTDSAPTAVVASAELRELGNRLLARLESDALYRKNDLRLADLAEALKLRPSQVTEILSRGLGTTFYDLVNRMRVEDAKRRLVDPACAHMNILGIAMDSGFPSKSTFNDQFKKLVGETPSEFRRRVSPMPLDSRTSKSV